MFGRGKETGRKEVERSNGGLFRGWKHHGHVRALCIVSRDDFAGRPDVSTRWKGMRPGDFVLLKREKEREAEEFNT